MFKCTKACCSANKNLTVTIHSTYHITVQFLLKVTWLLEIEISKAYPMLILHSNNGLWIIHYTRVAKCHRQISATFLLFFNNTCMWVLQPTMWLQKNRPVVSNMKCYIPVLTNNTQMEWNTQLPGPTTKQECQKHARCETLKLYKCQILENLTSWKVQFKLKV